MAISIINKRDRQKTVNRQRLRGIFRECAAAAKLPPPGQEKSAIFLFHTLRHFVAMLSSDNKCLSHKVSRPGEMNWAMGREEKSYKTRCYSFSLGTF